MFAVRVATDFSFHNRCPRFLYLFVWLRPFRQIFRIVTSIRMDTVRFLTLSKKVQIHHNFIKTVRVLAKSTKVRSDPMRKTRADIPSIVSLLQTYIHGRQRAGA